MPDCGRSARSAGTITSAKMNESMPSRVHPPHEAQNPRTWLGVNRLFFGMETSESESSTLAPQPPLVPEPIATHTHWRAAPCLTGEFTARNLSHKLILPSKRRQDARHCLQILKVVRSRRPGRQ